MAAICDEWRSDDGSVRLILGDCLEVLQSLPADSIDLIATDPPYFKIKGEAWDRQWDTPEQFLEWIGTLCEEWLRVLKPNGSLYVFAASRMAAKVECKVGEWFNVLNRITWKKDAGWAKHQCKEEMRGWFPSSESIIFAEHYGADNIAKGEAGYAAKCDELRGFVFEPLRKYLDDERRRAGVDKAAINGALGFSPTPGGMASRHYFSRSQWCLPTAEHYEAMRRCLSEMNHGGVYLRREYEDLRREYEDLRRPFSVTADVPYTDVWDFPTVPYRNGKHPCEKPFAMMRHIVEASSKPGAMVLDGFMGSGTTGAACIRTGRRFIGIEIEPRYFEIAKQRCLAELGRYPLFEAPQAKQSELFAEAQR